MKHIKSIEIAWGSDYEVVSRGLRMNRGLHHCVTSAGAKQIAVLALLLRKIMFFQNVFEMMITIGTSGFPLFDNFLKSLTLHIWQFIALGCKIVSCYGGAKKS